MKELSIEEKAKRYDEVLERAKGVIEQNPLMEYLKKGIEYILPELKESEDERIRKALINGFNKLDKSAVWYNGITNGEILAWLEKQCEHANFRNKIQVGDKVTRNEDGMLVNLSQLNRVAKKQGEQKPAENSCKNSDNITTEEKDMTEYKKGFECGKQRVLKYPEDFGLCKKVAWSEEDEKILNSLISSLARIGASTRTDSTSINYTFSKEIDWLKSIKNRVQPQLLPQQEWSKRDEKLLNDAISLADECDDIELRDWLKSLRPQNRWKPSEKQLNELHKVITNTGFNPYVIKSLYDDLKKLREG